MPESSDHASDHRDRCISLCRADAQALDALIQSLATSTQPSPTSSSHLKLADTIEESESDADMPASVGVPDQHVRIHPRAQRVSQVMATIGCCSCEEPDENLTDRTMAKLREAKQRQRFAQQVQSLAGGGGAGGGFQWRDLMAVAAVMMIGLSLLWPMLTRSRAQARRVACANNLATAGTGFNQYAADHGGVLPRGRVKPGAQWYNVGHQPTRDGFIHSNSAHLYILIKKQYVNDHTLACPDNPHAVTHADADRHDWPTAAAVSFSYQNQYTPKAIRITLTPNLPILADKNPLFEISSNGLIFRPDDLAMESSSEAHKLLIGQNTLDASGTVRWLTQPVTPQGDNIWLVSGLFNYQGTEAPRENNDAFLVP